MLAMCGATRGVEYIYIMLQAPLCPASRFCSVRDSTAHGALLCVQLCDVPRLSHEHSSSQSNYLLPTGNVLNSFNPSDGGSDIASAVNSICLDFVWLGLACMVASYLEVAAWMTIGAHNLAVCSRCDCETRSWFCEVCGCTASCTASMFWHRHTHL